MRTSSASSMLSSTNYKSRASMVKHQWSDQTVQSLLEEPELMPLQTPIITSKKTLTKTLAPSAFLKSSPRGFKASLQPDHLRKALASSSNILTKLNQQEIQSWRQASTRSTSTVKSYTESCNQQSRPISKAPRVYTTLKVQTRTSSLKATSGSLQ